MIATIVRALVLLIVIVGVTSGAHAEDKQKAREAYRAATQHYDLGEYQQALDGFKEAYKSYDDPAFLFNIAQCHRALGHKQEAITLYKSYLRNTPGAPNRDEVQKIVADLQAATDSDKPAATPLVTSPTPPPPVVQAPRQNAAAVTRSVADKPTHSRKWVWGVVAAAVVVVGVGVGLGVGLGTQSHSPMASYGTVSF